MVIAEKLHAIRILVWPFAHAETGPSRAPAAPTARPDDRRPPTPSSTPGPTPGVELSERSDAARMLGAHLRLHSRTFALRAPHARPRPGNALDMRNSELGS